MLAGKAEPEMCASNMKQQAQRKANAPLRCIPSPIVIADSDLGIIEYNDKFVETSGPKKNTAKCMTVTICTAPTCATLSALLTCLPLR